MNSYYVQKMQGPRPSSQMVPVVVKSRKLRGSLLQIFSIMRDDKNHHGQNKGEIEEFLEVMEAELHIERLRLQMVEHLKNVKKAFNQDEVVFWNSVMSVMNIMHSIAVIAHNNKA